MNPDQIQTKQQKHLPFNIQCWNQEMISLDELQVAVHDIP